MTADMGARNIRDELAAMEVMAVNPVHRLVTPRLWAASMVGMLLVSLVIVAGVGGGFVFNVMLQGVSPGAYFQGAASLLRIADLYVVAASRPSSSASSPRSIACHRGMNCSRSPVGVGLAVKQARGAVVPGVFAVNYVITTLYTILSPQHALLMVASVAPLRPVASPAPRSASPTGSPAASPSSARFGAVLRPVLWHAVVDVVLRLRYRRTVVMHMSDIVAGAGAFVIGGGMVFVVAAMALAVGATVGVQAFAGLSQIGAESFVGLIGSYANVREITPLIAAVALSAQVGSAFTAEIGAMRISDEIDALEVMSIPSLTYLVCTRLVAMIVALIPLYLVAMFTSFAGTKLVNTELFGMSPGLYDYYFNLYLPPIDIVYSLIKVIVFATELSPHPRLLRLLRHRRAGRAWAGPSAWPSARASSSSSSPTCCSSYLFWGGEPTVSLTG